MTIPPFPSQELAKLVLGYLAEEQLMTAYDEFLQASPYLDAFRNEYDRIFMTSLRNILAEYRAVKIYVETCKPFLLRKRMLQCSNLLDVVKLLINFADINKLHSQDVTTDRISIPKLNIPSKQNKCETCDSVNLASCSCVSKLSKSVVQTASIVESNSIASSVETTALEDLPGNHINAKKKSPRVLEKKSTIDSILDVNDTTRQTTSACNNSSSNEVNCNQNVLIKSNESVSINTGSTVKTTDIPECREKIEEFNNIYNTLCSSKSNADTRLVCISGTETLGKGTLHTNFQTFASGVRGNDNKNIPVPDSSTSENSITTQIMINENTLDVSVPSEVPKNVNDHLRLQQSNLYTYPKIKPTDQKIKILSDIKVDSPFPTLTNATSTPLMQTIVINGTPAYKQKLPMANDNYTKDEIMAMPTIIVVPTSGSSKKVTQIQSARSKTVKKLKTKSTSSKNLLGPLVIDVSSSPVVKPNNDNTNQSAAHLKSGIETGLVRTVDSIKNASVPKDNTISDSTQITTPQVLPPVRKSSSTPRRNSHIRVLDFTTPRRILHETEHNTIPEEINNDVEILVTNGPNVVFPKTSDCTNNIINMSSVKIHKIETCLISNLSESKKKSNWDADLRVLAVGNKKPPSAAVKKPSVRKSRKKTDNGNDSQKKDNESEENLALKKKRTKRKKSPKDKKSKRMKLEEEEEQYNNTMTNDTNITVKPTFNIVAADQQIIESTKVCDSQNKVSNEEVRETPEAERLLLQNEIGAKLNISDFLETPYKQALYDIQMETPKFLGSVLPDEPISDIKITNIPTPRFFDMPKPTQATPSYPSRSTDYSSGGSYYKPDEQDYLRIPDLDCLVSSSKAESKTEVLKITDNSYKRNSRPVRKCTKNVSYKATSKSKSTDDKVEITSSCSETASVNSSFEHRNEASKTPKTPKLNKSKTNSKSEPKKNIVSSQTRKTPVKKNTNTFMKIKPRRPTPIKESKKTRRKTVVPVTGPTMVQIKKRISGKNKIAQITPAVTSAPTKSRRKSSTPRKLHCTKQFNSESSAESPEMNVTKAKPVTPNSVFVSVQCQDSDTEQLALRWSDDGSQDSKPKISECEDISKIKEYIESSLLNKPDLNDAKGTLQVDLIKRGFDAATAKIIERDLLDIPDSEQTHEVYVPIPATKLHEPSFEGTTGREKPLVQTGLQHESTEEDDLELSVHECNEESHNYVLCISEAEDTPKGNPVTLRDAWSMEVCIEDGVPIRLRATSLKILFDNEPQNEDTGYSFRETEIAVSSISNIDTLYTPLKDRRTQCYEIFDSTLTSIDTPLKLNSPIELIQKTTEIEIVVEEEKDKADINKKRKRLQPSTSPENSLNEAKKTKPEAQYLFNSTNIQNIDIESVLKKLHGPEGLQ